MSIRARKSIAGLIVAAVAGLSCAATARAQVPGPIKPDDLAAFWTGKTVTFVSGSSPGGSYDVGSRLIARHLGRHVPGRPNVIVQNMPGAGSMTAANHLYTVAAKDGSVIGMFGRGLYLEALFGAPGARFDPRRFGWIGSYGREVATSRRWRGHAVQDAGRRPGSRNGGQHRPARLRRAFVRPRAQRAGRHQTEDRQRLSRHGRADHGDRSRRGAGQSRSVDRHAAGVAPALAEGARQGKFPRSTSRRAASRVPERCAAGARSCPERARPARRSNCSLRA